MVWVAVTVDGDAGSVAVTVIAGVSAGEGVSVLAGCARGACVLAGVDALGAVSAADTGTGTAGAVYALLGACDVAATGDELAGLSDGTTVTWPRGGTVLEPGPGVRAAGSRAVPRLAITVPSLPLTERLATAATVTRALAASSASMMRGSHGEPGAGSLMGMSSQ
jgi:hypothetical protein